MTVGSHSLTLSQVSNGAESPKSTPLTVTFVDRGDADGHQDCAVGRTGATPVVSSCEERMTDQIDPTAHPSPAAVPMSELARHRRPSLSVTLTPAGGEL
jgi:hypothetical protein